MDSGGFGESDIMAVSSYTKRILSLTKVQILSLMFSDTNNNNVSLPVTKTNTFSDLTLTVQGLHCNHCIPCCSCQPR